VVLVALFLGAVGFLALSIYSVIFPNSILVRLLGELMIER
jgi:hypothetical protein